MSIAAEQDDIRRLVDLYVRRVLAGRHRQVALRGRKCQATIMHTLLGFEVKAGRKRITCPDRITARYLRGFAEIGLETVRIPYDPTITRGVISEVESLLEAIKGAAGSNPAACRRIYRKLRKQLQTAEQEQVTGILVTRRFP
ncbi:MAG: hypothetical protein EHM61_26010 [Acidobacteria bacterium]|nr:MAG: hypothetical protein EHM61_26010 [Acidobacteriota bacterium]